MDREKVIREFMKWCDEMADECPVICLDALAMLKEQEEERKRMISWLGKFCRHIDNGDKWLSDEENIAFFREKMKQQFGWDS